MTWTTPPDPDELELSLFGPGIGESVVVHLGHGNWIIVDSCLDENARPVALGYLEAIGIDASRDVKLAVVTHWRDDHLRGIAQIVRDAESAEFTCSAGLRCPELFTLIGAHEQIRPVDENYGLDEFARVLEILSSRVSGRRPPSRHRWAAADMTLFSRQVPCDMRVTSLSPSASTITDSLHRVVRAILRPGQPIRRIPPIEPNDLSVVLRLEVRHHGFLLGADLERGPDERRGWRAIVNSRPKASSQAYKVAHHGSEDADFDGIWSDLLVANCHVLITPYARGRVPRPAEADIARMKSRTPNAYCTSWPVAKSPPHRMGVDSTMNEIAKTRRVIAKKPGHIRLRVPIDAAPSSASIELFNGALRI